MRQRTIDDHFIDWMSENIRFGYGSGEPHTIPALRAFLSLCNVGHYNTSYDCRVLEEKLTPTTAWLLMNVLCQAQLIEYGTSPRCGWLTPEGIKLRDYMLSKTEEDLILLVCNTEDNDYCTRHFCNCGEGGYSENKLCHNPFWKEFK